ncbi:hypothetical protein [Micromonospora sp. WMMD714]|uniref:hypothetical protein n=1 Tax=Micromonospora sp. WMMD714 TaxID=3016097 RepID=UPI00249C4135|nr:hypothetical protein [Micromonospora sp. WMMD714]WFE66009.1 hypothetical protein O7625_23205 [Micromonospora sp. WMMD714]
MTHGSRLRGWVVAFAVGVLVVGLGGFLVVQGLDKADKWASVFGVFVGLSGVALSVAGGLRARQRADGQSVTGSTIGGGVGGVAGDPYADPGCRAAPVSRVALPGGAVLAVVD